MTIGLDISVLNDKQKTGIAFYTYHLIDALLNLKSADKYILFGIATFQTYEYLKNIHFKNYPNVQMKIYKMPAKFFRTAFLLWQLFDFPPIDYFVGEVDFFHSFNWYMPPQRKGKKIGTVFDLTSITNPEWHYPETAQLDKVRLERLAKSADLIITISESTRRDFLKFYPYKKVEVIYPAASPIFKKKVNLSKTKKVLEKYQLQPGYFLSVSTLEPRKNLKKLIESFLKSGLKRKLVLAGGSGWKNEEFFKLINENKIITTGYVPDEDLTVLYQQALCLVYPSLYEGFGMPILEAMESGTPVIASNVSSLPEVGGDAVLYVDPLRSEEIKKALIRIEEDENFRKNLIQKGFRQTQKYSWEKSAKKLMSFYKSL